jgi:hypothetical protein
MMFTEDDAFPDRLHGFNRLHLERLMERVHDPFQLNPQYGKLKDFSLDASGLLMVDQPARMHDMAEAIGSLEPIDKQRLWHDWFGTSTIPSSATPVLPSTFSNVLAEHLMFGARNDTLDNYWNTPFQTERGRIWDTDNLDDLFDFNLPDWGQHKANYFSVEDNDPVYQGWIIVYPTEMGSASVDDIWDCMRITVCWNILQCVRYRDYDNFESYFNNMTPARCFNSQQRHGLDPLHYITHSQATFLYNIMLTASHNFNNPDYNRPELGENGYEATCVMPMRLLRTVRYPSSFGVFQPLALDTRETYLYSNVLGKMPLPLDHTPALGSIWLGRSHFVQHHEGIWDIKHNANAPIEIHHFTTCPDTDEVDDDGEHVSFWRASVYSLGLTGRYGPCEIDVPTTGLPATITREVYANIEDFKAYVLGSFLANVVIEEGLGLVVEAPPEDADPSVYVATWKDKRPCVTLDYAKPHHATWSDLLKCVKCNQRVRVLFASGNSISFVQCPSCKDEKGINTEHLMGGWRPALVGLSTLNEGETMME